MRTALASSRVVTLTGPGGVGKTRLSVEVAAGALGDPGCNVVFVELAPVHDEGLVATVVAAAAGLSGAALAEPAVSLIEHLGARRWLLVLDNCEHLLEACAELTLQLVASCPGLHVLCTSRERLGIAPETVWPVLPLDLPDDDGGDIAASDAVRLFCDRARACSPSFSLTTENAHAVARLCRRLDGLPLAIELGAGRVGALSPAQILERLDTHFAVLAARERDRSPRHQTLTATLEWSHELLSGEEQRLFRRLAVFSGGFDIEAVQAVGTDDDADVVDLLERLIAKSLVDADASGSRSRYRLMETVRDYARGKLMEARGEPAVRQQHAVYYASLVSRASGELTGPKQRAWLTRLDDEIGNIRGALSFAETSGQLRLGLVLAADMRHYWYVRGSYAEGLRWLERFLHGVQPCALTTRRARLAYAFLMAASNNVAAAMPVFEECIGQIRASGDAGELARALHFSGQWQIYSDPSGAFTTTTEAIALAREANDGWCLADSLRVSGWVLALRGALNPARTQLTESVTVALDMGDRRVASLSRVALGFAAMHRLALSQSQALFAEARAAGTVVLGPSWTAMLESFSADALRRAGNYAAAEDRLSGSLRHADTRGLLQPRSLALGHLGRLALDQGDLWTARQRFEQALETGVPVFATWWLVGLGRAMWADGDPQAAKILEQCVQEARRHQHRPDEAEASALLACLLVDAGQLSGALTGIHAALSLTAALSSSSAALTVLEAAAYVHALAGDAGLAARAVGAVDEARDRLDVPRAATFLAFWTRTRSVLDARMPAADLSTKLAEGAQLSLRAAVDEVAAEHNGAKPYDALASLTRAEREVARLASLGKTNPEIAAELFVSPRTVQTHLGHVFAKLGIASRRELIRLLGLAAQ